MGDQERFFRHQEKIEKKIGSRYHGMSVDYICNERYASTGSMASFLCSKEKIRMIKVSLTREAQIEQDREMKRIRKADEEARRRIQEIDAKMWEEVRKREHEYKVKREAIVRFGQQKEAAEQEAVKEIMRTIDEKLDRSEKQQHANILDKVTRVQEHNHEILEKK